MARDMLNRILTFYFLVLFYCLSVEATNYKKKIGKPSDFHQFRTRPDILAPRWAITVHDKKALAPGYWFVAPYKDLNAIERGEAWIGPHIYDQKGELIWSGTDTFDHFKAFDIRIAMVNGTEMLTAIYPHDNAAVILNNHYQVVETVVHSSTWDYSNMHDFNVVEDGRRALVLTKDAAVTLSKEKSKVVGYNGNCLVRGDGMKYLDITTQPPKTIFFWNGTNHIGLDETQTHVKHTPIEELCSDDKKWDIHHFNAIDIFPDGDFLVSSRSTSTLFKISHINGDIVWRIGGLKSDFELTKEARFNYQHHARVQSQNDTHAVVSLLDNSKETDEADEYTARSHSAGIIVALDTQKMTGELVGEYPHPHDGYTHKRGSNHVLPNGNVFMGWADNILVSEHAPDGRVLMEAHIKPNLDSYRCYKFPWVGKPLDPPDLASTAFLSGNDTWTMSHASWNGATEVATWKLYEWDVKHSRLGDLLVTEPRNGFETELTFKGYADYVAVVALDEHGHTIGKSKPVHAIPPVEDEQSVGSFLPTSADKITENGQSQSGDASKSDNANPVPVAWIVLFVVGFVSSTAICASIWAIRHFKGRPWWRKGSRYGDVPMNGEEQQDEAKIPLRSGDDERDDE